MRIAVLLCGIALAAGQTQIELGYDRDVKASAGTFSHFYLEVPASALGENGTSTYLRVQAQSTGLALDFDKTAADFWIKHGSPPDTTGPYSLRKSDSYYYRDYVGPITQAGRYYISVKFTNCPCEMKLGTFLRRSNTDQKPFNGDPYGPFPIVDDRATSDWYYTDFMSAKGYGAPGYVTLEKLTDVYVKFEEMSKNEVSSRGTVAVVFKKDVAPTEEDPTQIAETATFLKHPSSGAPSPSSGFMIKKSLSAGTWYIAPYIYSVPSGGIHSSHRFDLAFGIGHEPSGAGAIAPSAALALLASALALFAASHF